MVVTPLLRGLFGIDIDGLHHTLTITPHLPVDWPAAAVRRLHVGDSVVNVSYKRDAAAMLVTVETLSGPAVHFMGGRDVMHYSLPAVEVTFVHHLPERGSRTMQPKVIEENFTTNSLHLEIEGIAGTETTLILHRNIPAVKLQVEGGEIAGDQLHIHFPSGNGYVSQAITVRW
jgi:hypothetical protein